MDGPATGGLRRQLSIWEAIGISVALMAPSMAANINPQGTASTVGRAVPLAFALATVGVLFVAYTFVRLCQAYHHAGSVYGFVGATLGARSGVVAGWSLLGTYIFYGVVTSAAAGIFGSSFLSAVGIWPDAPDWAAFALEAVALVGVFLLAITPARRGTRLLLVVEGVTVLLILLVAVVVLVRLLGGSAPDGHTFDLSVFTVPPGTEVSALFLGVVFGFLSFAGFEAAATLGEEARNPRRDVPRAILGTAIFGGVYFVFVTAIEVMGFGADEAGVTAFTSSGSLMGDLGTSYIGAWVGDLITLGAAVSAFGCALACAVGASRLLFALARDGVLAAPLAEVSTSRGTPVRATAVVVVAMAVDRARRRRGVRRGPVRRVQLVRHDRHADPDRGLRAGHHRRGPAAVLLRAAPGEPGRDRDPGAGAAGARLHAVPQRDPVPDRPGRLVPGGLPDLDRIVPGRGAGPAVGGPPGRCPVDRRLRPDRRPDRRQALKPRCTCATMTGCTRITRTAG